MRAYGDAVRAGVELQSRAWFNENLESRHFYVPGEIAFLCDLALVYAAALFGGYVADKVIGYQRSILLGAAVASFWDRYEADQTFGVQMFPGAAAQTAAATAPARRK